MNKVDVKPLYRRLIGILGQTPAPEGQHTTINDAQSWQDYHEIIDNLNKLTGKDYSRFKISPNPGEGYPYVETLIFRQKVGGLIETLYGEFFPDENPPFGSVPQSMITQNVAANQNTNVETSTKVTLDNLISRAIENPMRSIIGALIFTVLAGVLTNLLTSLFSWLLKALFQILV